MEIIPGIKARAYGNKEEAEMTNQRPTIDDRAVRTEDVQAATLVLARVDGVTKVPPDLYDQAVAQLADFMAAARYYRRGGI